MPTALYLLLVRFLFVLVPACLFFADSGFCFCRHPPAALAFYSAQLVFAMGVGSATIGITHVVMVA